MEIFRHKILSILFQVNTFVIGKSDDAIIIDPSGDEAEGFSRELQGEGINVKHVLITHGHFDHLGSVDRVLRVFPEAKVYLHEAEKPYFNQLLDWAKEYGIPRPHIEEPDVWLSSDQELSLSGFTFRIVHAPGHSPGSMLYYTEEPVISESEELNNKRIAFCGDVIFEGSIGRVDFPLCNKDDMVSSLKKLMDEIHPDTILFPGHGNSTTMGREMLHNPFLRSVKSNNTI